MSIFFEEETDGRIKDLENRIEALEGVIYDLIADLTCSKSIDDETKEAIKETEKSFTINITP